MPSTRRVKTMALVVGLIVVSILYLTVYDVILFTCKPANQCEE